MTTEWTDEIAKAFAAKGKKHAEKYEALPVTMTITFEGSDEDFIFEMKGENGLTRGMAWDKLLITLEEIGWVSALRIK